MKKIVILALLVLTLNGCSYVMHGDTQIINLKTSDNKRVKVKVKNDNKESVYTLPTKIKVHKSKNDLVVTTISTECITATKTMFPSSIDNWVWGNIANLGLGLIKDFEGSMWQYDSAYTINVKRDNSCIQKAKELNTEMLNLHLAL